MKYIVLVCVNIFLMAGLQCGKAQEQPNILWITLEDISPQFVGCYGNVDVHTPNIDKIAQDGVRFDRAYSNATVCAPSRNTIITGCRNEVLGTGNHRSNSPIPHEISGFPTYMREAGYFTVNIGKTDYNTSNAKAIIKSSWNKNTGNKGSWANRNEGQPFFAVFNVFECHQSRTMTMPYAWWDKTIYNKLPDSLITPMGNLEMPPLYRNTSEMRKHLARVYNSVNAADMHVGEILDRLKADGLYNETIIFIFGDHGEAIPGGKGTAVGLGHRVPFIVRFPEKYRHLSPWEHGELSNELLSFEDLAPTILSLLGIEIPDYMNGRALLGDNRVEGERCVYGSRNRLDAVYGTMRSVVMGDYIYTRSFHTYQPMLKYKFYHDVADITKAIRRDFNNGKLNEIQSFMLQPNVVETLYNLKDDVWETNNLANKKEYSSLLKKMQDSLWKNIKDNRDVHLLPEYEIEHIIKAGKLPYNERLNVQILPIDKIIEVLKLTGGSEDVISQQIDNLKHTNKIVRYWAAVGLNCQTASLSAYQKQLISYFLNETYPPAQIEFASVLVKHFAEKKAIDTLQKYITGKNENLSNQAVQMVQHMSKEKQMLFVKALKSASVNENKRIAYPAKVVLYYLTGEPELIGGQADKYYQPYSLFLLKANLIDKNGKFEAFGDVHFDLDSSGGNISNKGSGIQFGKDFFLTHEFSIAIDVFLNSYNKQELISLSSIKQVDDINLIYNNGELNLKVGDNTYSSLKEIEIKQWENLLLTYNGNEMVLYKNNEKIFKEEIALFPEDYKHLVVGKRLNGKLKNLGIYHIDISPKTIANNEE